MSNQTTAVHYDGKTAIPQQVAVLLHIANGTIEFKTAEEGNCKWLISDIVFIKRDSSLYLEHGNDNLQQLIIQDTAFINALHEYRKNHGHISWYQKLLDLGTTSYFIIAFAIIAIIGLSYAYAIPWIGEKSVILIPEEYDDKLGSSAFLENEYLVSIDSSKTKTLNQFAAQLQLNNRKKLKFTVVHSDEINAFALPDGNIVVFTGILNEMKNYDELAGLLGHEASHVNNRHSMKMICRGLSGYLFVSFILGDANGIMAVIGDNVNSLQSLSFSRTFEREADEDGFKILVKNKINPKGMSNLFKRLEKEKSISIPEFLSSHPITGDRIATIDKMIKAKSYSFTENQTLKRLFFELKQ